MHYPLTDIFGMEEFYSYKEKTLQERQSRETKYNTTKKNIYKKYTGCAKKKKDILNIHIKSVGINIFSQKFYWTESTIFEVKCQKFTFIVKLFMT